MERREALAEARLLAPEASAAEHVTYASFLVGSGVVEAPEVVRWGTDYPDGSIALYSEGYGVYVMEFGGWFFYSPMDGHRYSDRSNPIGEHPYIVGMVRTSEAVNYVGQDVSEEDESRYRVGTVALDDSRDVWYYDGGYWSVYFKSNRGQRNASGVHTSQAPMWGAVIVA